ncbi:short-chain fatty acyl-CoA regulator family protein [Methylobacterium sp. UNC300MFChir4.1]|uniref:short-chain fatty acyl-CoA regulator family protein n=1 Tax=Methylobacterium sp. UNC300MFChir4.1 TaxID=1502747 RepID=UPI000C21024D|nr:short-chain fatty acyl-CoA regulator family protein [Methylobacterium sp. UNC300MFChir4.1]
MKKVFVGGRLRRLREERGMTQAALAAALDLSASYLNQIEKNQRPLTVPVLLRINAAFGVDVQLFSEGDEARLFAELREILSDPQVGEASSATEIRDLVANMPGIARALTILHRRLRGETDRAEALVAHLGLRSGEGVSDQPAAFEAVRDFFYAHHNYFDALDTHAERLFGEARLGISETETGLARYLAGRHGIRIAMADEGPLRVWNEAERSLHLLRRLSPGQRAFQMATQLALIELDGPIDALARSAGGGETHRLARIGLANYVAGALIMPYRPFLAAAEKLGYDIECLSERFGVGYEAICHRLSSLQRPEARGVPFFLIRVDRAGNISKRQSATDFHFSRGGGTCPFWNVYEAFAQPGRVLTQIARMPDGRAYLWVARTVEHGTPGYGAPRKTFAMALGCDLRHADRLVYAKGLDLSDPNAATPIGAGCKVCEREACVQRAFPFVGRPLAVDETRSLHAPYAGG